MVRTTQYLKSFRKGPRGTTLFQKGFPRKSYLSESGLVLEVWERLSVVGAHGRFQVCESRVGFRLCP